MSQGIAVFPTPRPVIRRVPVDRPWAWLAAGWRDIAAAPGPSLACGLVPVLAGWLAILLTLAILVFVAEATGGGQGRTVIFDLPECRLRLRTLRDGWSERNLK